MALLFISQVKFSKGGTNLNQYWGGGPKNGTAFEYPHEKWLLVLLWPIEKTNETECLVGKGVNWRGEIDGQIISHLKHNLIIE